MGEIRLRCRHSFHNDVFDLFHQFGFICATSLENIHNGFQ